jgi:hypothetical protein
MLFCLVSDGFRSFFIAPVRLIVNVRKTSPSCGKFVFFAISVKGNAYSVVAPIQTLGSKCWISALAHVFRAFFYYFLVLIS